MEQQTARAIYASESGGNAEDIEMTLKVPTPIQSLLSKHSTQQSIRYRSLVAATIFFNDNH